MNFTAGLRRFGISLQKSQFDNIQMLLELFADFNRVKTTSLIQEKSAALKELSKALSNNEDVGGIDKVVFE